LILFWQRGQYRIETNLYRRLRAAGRPGDLPFLDCPQATQAREVLTVASFIGFRGSEEQRFWNKVIVNQQTGCWEWQAGKSDNYGVFSLTRTQPGKKNKVVKAHVWAYEYCLGPIEPSKELHHVCQCRKCVNPWHTEKHTRKTHRAQHAKIFCINGHLFAPGSYRIRVRNGTNRRVCIQCERLYGRAKYRRKVPNSKVNLKLRKSP